MSDNVPGSRTVTTQSVIKLAVARQVELVPRAHALDIPPSCPALRLTSCTVSGIELALIIIHHAVMFGVNTYGDIDRY